MSGIERRLIVNADDLGACAGVNAGIARAHRDGIVTSASLMVNMPGTAEAVAMAADLPALSIGLHTNLTGEGTPPPVALDDVDGCRREIADQVDAFIGLIGRRPTHLDAHHNIHRHPPLTQLFVEAASALGIPMREHSRVRYFPDFYGQWDGQMHPEQISVTHLRWMLDTEIGAGVTELSCHPGVVDPHFVSPYHRERQIELDTLCDPAVRRHIDDTGITLINYHDVVGSTAGSTR